MGARAIDITHDETHLKELVRRATRGEDVILTEEGRPVARIIPIRAKPVRRQFGSWKGQIEIADDFDAPLEDFRDYMWIASGYGLTSGHARIPLVRQRERWVERPSARGDRGV